MEELKQAFAALGLDETASKEEVEKRYSLLLKRHRAREKALGNESANEADREQFARVTEAYRYILSYEERKYTEEFNQQEYGKYRNMAGTAQKLDHYWRYYKYHTLGAVALLALIIYGIVSYVDHREHQKYLASLPPVDVTVSFMGTFMENTEAEGGKKDHRDENGNFALARAMLPSFPDWKRIETDIVFVPQDEASQFAYLQKAAVMLFSESPDIYMMDRFMFEWIGRQNVLLPLDDKPSLASLGKDGLAVRLATEEFPEAKIYGYDLAKSRLGQALPIWGPGELIVGIRANAANPDKALQFIETFLKTAP